MEIKRIDAAGYLQVTELFDKYRVFYQQPSDLALAETYIKSRLQNNESVIFVAFVDGAPAGFTQLYPFLSSVRAVKNWLLNDLFVDAEHRKQGIGEALIQTAMEFAKADGATYVQLETAFDNHTAQSLYEAIGFVKQEVSSSFFQYRIPV